MKILLVFLVVLTTILFLVKLLCINPRQPALSLLILALIIADVTITCSLFDNWPTRIFMSFGLILAICSISFIVICSDANYNSESLITIFCLGIITFAGTTIAFLWILASVINSQTSKTVVEETRHIVQLTDTQSIVPAGGLRAHCVSVSNNQYNYYYEASENTFLQESIDCNISAIHYLEKGATPHVDYIYTEMWSRGLLSKEPRKVNHYLTSVEIYVPEGSIAEYYTLDGSH